MGEVMFEVYIKRPFPVKAVYFDGTYETAVAIAEQFPDKLGLGSFDKSGNVCHTMLITGGKDTLKAVNGDKVTEVDFQDQIRAGEYVVIDGDVIRHYPKGYFDTIYMKPKELSNDGAN
jgi:hypothetical protein